MAILVPLHPKNMAQGSTVQNAKQTFWNRVLPWATEMKRSVRASPLGKSAVKRLVLPVKPLRHR